MFQTPSGIAFSSASSLAPYRDQVIAWFAAGVQDTTIHSALIREWLHWQLFLGAPHDAEAAQVDFGAGSAITDVHTGEVLKTRFFIITYAGRGTSMLRWCATRLLCYLAGLPSAQLDDKQFLSWCQRRIERVRAMRTILRVFAPFPLTCCGNGDVVQAVGQCRDACR